MKEEEEEVEVEEEEEVRRKVILGAQSSDWVS